MRDSFSISLVNAHGSLLFVSQEACPLEKGKNAPKPNQFPHKSGVVFPANPPISGPLKG